MLRVLLLMLLMIFVACGPQSEIIPTPTATETPLLLADITPIATAQPAASPTATLPPSATPSPTVPPTATPSPTETLTPTITPTLERRDLFMLARPIPQDAGRTRVDWVDRTYPYGGTQFGAWEVHLGVEFVNPRFTPVAAAADGVVLYAGDDSEELFGPALNYYGNLVVIEHGFRSPEGLPVYTLYAHLQRYDVATGQRVTQGQVIGSVGDSGIAIGPHLHFEVRVGQDAYDYRITRNPELWIHPYPQFGMLAGRVQGADGRPLYEVTLSVRSDTVEREAYTYGSDRVNSDPLWGENFTLGDLPAGDYTVQISDRNGRLRFREVVTILPGRTAWIEIVLDE